MNSLFNQNKAVYSLDNSALVAAYSERYPIENFPTFWQKFGELIIHDRLKMVEIAFDEASKNKGIVEWYVQNQLKTNLRWPIDDTIQNKVKEILLQFPKLLDDRSGKSGADPWVIAFAMIFQKCVVVTEEKATGKAHRPKIPDVCDYFNVECIQLVDLIKREQWRF